MTSAEIDLRVGGRWRYVMVANGGFEVAFHGEYREIVPDERLVSTEVYELPGASDEDGVLDVVTFAEADGHDPHASGPGAEQAGPRRDRRLRHGGRHAGADGAAGGAGVLARLTPGRHAPAGAGAYWSCWLTERARRALWLAALFLWMTPLLAARS